MSYADRFVPVLPRHAWPGGLELHALPLTESEIAAADCVAILTDHDGVNYEALAAGARLVVDTRNAVPSRHPHVFKLGAPALSQAEKWTGAAEDAA